ncbi:MAG: hypothetical protein EPN91_09580 [Salinibacterium sp.]|nr:MAG: hypothetical protein EPN91_09580 [Salinibacterium sp.]
MATIITKQESERGCGFRKPGAIYLVSDGPGRSCGRMPLPLHVCPTCSQGIKPARGWTWIDSKPILAAAALCKHQQVEVSESPVDASMVDVSFTLFPAECQGCPMSGREDDRVGLMWVGGKFYSRPENFIEEAKKMGLSKRIAQIPKDLIVGKTWVWLAHRETFPAVHTEECITTLAQSNYDVLMKLMATQDTPPACNCNAKPTAGVFHAFVPTRIEYVIKGTETEEELDALEKRGLTLVRVERIGENGELFPTPPPTATAADLDDGN